MTTDPRILAMASTAADSGGDSVALLKGAHAQVASAVRPVYAMNDAQPTSRTLDRRRGSCSQRMAVLEAIARAAGIATRVQGLVVDGSFWYQRFPSMKYFVPRDVVLAWPEFATGDGWLSLTDLFGSSCSNNQPAFSNAPGETLFEATATTRISWKPGTGCDLSAFVRRDLGYYDHRDDLFTTYGQTLCPPARLGADLMLSRRSSTR